MIGRRGQIEPPREFLDAVRSLPPPMSIGFFLAHYARRKRRRGESVFCLQIGANDGVINDPVHPYLSTGWRGLLIEPQPDVFEILRATYAARPQVELANVAIAPTAGTMPFYRVAVSRQRWATGLSSFVRANLERHIDNGYIQAHAQREGVVLPADRADLIETVPVATEPLSSVLAGHGVRRAEVVCIDTEGYDFAVLSMVDLDMLSPEVVVFESKNLSDPDYAAALALLGSRGYAVHWDDGDTLATTIGYPRWAQVLDRRRWQLRRTAARLRRAPRRVTRRAGSALKAAAR